MNYLSLFSGAGGFEWFGKLMGWHCVGYVEKDEYCQKVLRARIRDGYFDDAPIFSNVRTFDGLPYRGKVDCITAGFPCQPFSAGGKRLGAKDERNLWIDTIRVLGEVQPGSIFLENSPMLATDGYLGEVLKGLAEIGYGARWGCLSASTIGAPHQRERIWIYAYPHGAGREGPLWCGLSSARRVSQHVRPSAYWTAFKSPAIGVAERPPAWGHRLRAVGNGIVPAVACEAWRRLNGDTT